MQTTSENGSEELSLISGDTVISFDRNNGSISSLRHTKWEYELIKDKERAECWRILLPLKDFQGHYIYSRDQQLSGVQEGAGYLRLFWKNVLGRNGKAFPIDVTMRAEVHDNAIRISLEIENKSDRPLAEIHYPMLGGICGLGERADSDTVYVKYWGDPHNQFKGVRGGPLFNLGDPKNMLAIPYPCTLLGTFTAHEGLAMPWVDVVNRKADRGVYIGHHEKVLRTC